MSDKLFEKATRKRYRFESMQGSLTCEDLWSLPLLTKGTGACLNDIAIVLDRSISRSETKNFVNAEQIADQELIDKLEIVKHVIAYKKANALTAARALATRQRNQRILEIIARKEDDELSDKSLDELKALMEEAQT